MLPAKARPTASGGNFAEQILRPIATVRVSMGMQARLDMLLPSSCGATTIPDVSQCCPRSTGAEDDAPFLFAMPLVWLETTFEAVLHLASESLRLAGIRRQ